MPSHKYLSLQVEFYFSDINLATTGFLYKIMVKDPEGFGKIIHIFMLISLLIRACSSVLYGALIWINFHFWCDPLAFYAASWEVLPNVWFYFILRQLLAHLHITSLSGNF